MRRTPGRPLVVAAQKRHQLYYSHLPALQQQKWWTVSLIVLEQECLGCFVGPAVDLLLDLDLTASLRELLPYATPRLQRVPEFAPSQHPPGEHVHFGLV